MSGHEELRNSADWQNQLYTRYHQKVFGICLYFLKDREEAKDATQDVFIKAFRAWKDFEWKCDPLTWIGAIAKHDCFSRRQRFRKHLDRRAQLAAEEEILNPNEPEEDLTLHRIRLEKILPGVRGKLREILRLSLEQGLNHREIAVRMGVSRVAITRRLTRFKKELQEVGLSRDFAVVRGGAVHPGIAREPVRAKSIPARVPARVHALELTAMEAERHLIAA
jgi:RNA polymerase sigma-70 factor (ECF subfamily)